MKKPNMLKNKLRNEEALPEDLSWTNMKDGIYDQMNIDGRDSNNKYRRFLFIFLGLFIFGGVGYVIFKYTQTKEQDRKDEKITVYNFENKSPIKNKLEPAQTAINNLTEKNTAIKNLNSTDDPNLSSPKQIKNYTQNTSAFTNKKVIATKRIDNKRTSIGNYKINNQPPTGGVDVKEEKNLRLISQEGNSRNKNENRIESKLTNEINVLPTLALNQFKIKPIDIETIYSVIDTNQEEIKVVKPSKTVRLELGAGANFAISDFGSSTVEPVTSLNERLDYGTSTSLRFTLGFDNFYVSSGVAFAKSYRKSAGVVVNSFEIPKNVLVEIHEDPISGIREVFRDSVLTQRDEVEFRLHNKLQYISVPIVVGIQKNHNSFYYHYGIGINLSFNNQFITKNVEFLLTNQNPSYTVTSFEFTKNFGLDIIGEFGFGFNLSDEMRIGSRLFYALKTGKYEGKSYSISNPSIVKGEVTVGYTF